VSELPGAGTALLIHDTREHAELTPTGLKLVAEV
jgi:hypothetical protein